MMRAPALSEPKSTTFPTYEVPQTSAMRGSAPPVQLFLADEAGARRGGRADPPPPPLPAARGRPTRRSEGGDVSVIAGSSRRPAPGANSNNVIIKDNNIIIINLRMMQSVTENYCNNYYYNYCLLNSVTVPKKQRIDCDFDAVAHNNNIKDNDDDSFKLDDKFGALITSKTILLRNDDDNDDLFGRDIPNEKSDQLQDYNLNCNDDGDDDLKEIGRRTKAIDGLLLLDGSTDRNLGYRCHSENDVFQRTIDKNTYVYHTPLRLRGGGESSLSTGTSGWGAPNAQQASNNNANSSSGWGSANPANQNNAGTQQWNTNRPPTSNQGPTSQDANKTNSNITSNSGNQQQQQQAPPATSQSNANAGGGWGQQVAKPQQANNGISQPVTGTANGQSQQQQANGSSNNNGQINAVNPTTKQQLEQLSNMREAIFSQDGWGGQHVNQDTNWDIPGSPEPSNKMDVTSGGVNSSGSAPWKPSVNNGTELWENTLRNGGQPPPQPQQKTPWGHTPSSNIGGTWGEDDETDSSNVWNGVPSTQVQQSQAQVQGQQQQSGPQQWGGSGAGAGGGVNNGGMWGGPKKENDWGGVSNASSSGWGGDHRGGGGGDPRAGGIDPRDMRPDMRDMRSNANDSMRLLDPREQLRMPGGDLRGDPRGITGRLNGAGAEAFWNQAGPHSSAQHMHHQSKMGGPAAAGWEEPSPPSQRRSVTSYDDGTSFWGNPQQAGSHWKDLPTGGAIPRNGASGGLNGPPGMAPAAARMAALQLRGNGGAGVGGGGASWDEPSANNKWDDHPKWQKPPKMAGGGPLWDAEPEWNGHKSGGGPGVGGANKQQGFTKEMVWNSKQFRCLVDMGFKKEDVENALRLRDMNYDEALDMLSPITRNQEAWRRGDDDHFDHQQFQVQGRFGGGPAGQMSFPPFGFQGNGAPNNMLNSMNAGGGGGGGANGSLINNISPAVVQKMLTQQQGGGGGVQGFGGGARGGGNMQPQSQPSTQQLRMLVQQIQMAVQAGYLNHQILNQPLAPQTLVLLNQLLQQIKTLQQLANQQSLAQNQCINGKPNSNAILQCSVLITKTKQQISNLQNQIAAQQAIYVKQQHQGGLGGGGPNEFLKNSAMHDSINAMQTNFADLGIKDPQMSQQQSRLNQWIKPDKEEGGEFSRAPGSSLATSPNMNPLGLTQPDGPWSSGRSGDTGWPDPAVSDVSNEKDSQWPSSAQPSLTDLVPEFEPGKPWKGTQIKSIEDDPSITPGSVVRSPLSIATIKDNELFNMNPSKSPPSGEVASLSSSTWSFNPPSSTTSAFTSENNFSLNLPIYSPQQGNKLPQNKVLDNNPGANVASELWGAPKPRGPPPGLSAKSGGGGSLVNGWSNSIAGSAPWAGGVASGAGPQQPQRPNWTGASQWLLLRNLTAQIDGSTLRTLCMQHGPLLSFHLHLHQGFALAKYSSREEATKAQTALNNCVLGNTTILAENPTDWDASAVLQQVASQTGASSGGWRAANQTQKQPGSGGDTWSSGWSNTANQAAANLWGSAALDVSDPARATPSSLNSFLPGDLLGGESI